MRKVVRQPSKIKHKTCQKEQMNLLVGVNSHLAQWGRLGSICSQYGDDMASLGRRLFRLMSMAGSESPSPNVINNYRSMNKVSL